MFAPHYWFDRRTKRGRPAKSGFNGPFWDHLKSEDFICSRDVFSRIGSVWEIASMR
jgi:hypothetical protein